MNHSAAYKNILPVIFLLLFVHHCAIAQENPNTRLFLDVPPDTFSVQIDSLTDSLRLPHPFLIPRSEKIYRNKFKLFRGVHYRVYPLQGGVSFKPPLRKGDSLTIVYRKYPFPLVPEYSHRELQKLATTDSSDSARMTGLVRTRLFDELDSFSGNLQRSGSIVRGIEIGSNQDLTLNSGLNLQLSGNITPNVQVVAALTDENTPIQPEGNTQTLREVDKVFVKIKSPYLGGTLGDFNLQYQNSQYGNLKRKLQGISAYGDFGAYHQQVTYATSRGTFHTNQFLGQEGNQGPYQLLGKNGEREIIVLAGTEKVYVNGQPQVRGENNDYIIDYSLAQLTFANNRLITSEDRIEVDFEYANNFQRYGKNFVGVSGSRQTLRPGFNYDVRFFREWDDTRNLLEDSAPLTEEEKRALTTAGDDPLKAAVSGAREVEPGAGNYELVTENGKSYFKYVGLNKGNYIVRFTGVGRGNGSYVKERLGVYRYVGEGLGSYLPVRLVPLAADKKFGDLNLSYRLGKNFSVQGEAAVSQLDRNVFSSLDDRDNLGQAVSLGAAYSNKATRLLGKSIGRVNWQMKWNQRTNQFSPLDREFRPEFNHKWNLATAELQTMENRLESNLQFQPKRFMMFSLDGGFIRRGSSISSQRGKAVLSLPDSNIVKGEIFGETVHSETFRERSDWRRAGARLGRVFWKLLPYIDFRAEDRQLKNADSSLTGFSFLNRAVGVKMHAFLGMNWNLVSRIREDFLYNPGQFEKRLKLSTSATHRVSFSILSSKRWQGRFSVVYRKKDYEPFFEQLPADSMMKYQPDPQFQDTSWNDRQSHLGNLELQYRNERRTIDSRWNYKIASELSALQEKVFLEVDENRGNYRFDETLQEYVPDPQGNFLLIILPTGKFESVTNIEASWQLRYRPRIQKKKPKGLKKILKNISTFTFLKLDEKSREQNIWQLYILNLKKYHTPATTLRGRYTINQDIFLFERNPNFGITLRSRYRDNLSNQFIDAGFNETNRTWDRSVSWRQSLLKRKLTQELEYKQALNFRSVSAIPSRNRDVNSRIGVVRYNYRPVYAWQVRLGVEAGFQRDRAAQNPLSVRYLEVKPQVNYSVKGKARAQAQLSFLNVKITENPLDLPIPFEMGKGKKEGNSLLWNLRFEYFMSNHVTVTVNYNGRRDAGAERTIHVAQAEVRAFF